MCISVPRVKIVDDHGHSVMHVIKTLLVTIPTVVGKPFDQLPYTISTLIVWFD